MCLADITFGARFASEVKDETSWCFNFLAIDDFGIS